MHINLVPTKPVTVSLPVTRVGDHGMSNGLATPSEQTIPGFVADAFRVVGKRPETMRKALKNILFMKRPQREVFVAYLAQGQMPRDAEEALVQLIKDLSNGSSRNGQKIARFAFQVLCKHYLAQAEAQAQAVKGKTQTHPWKK